MVRNATSKSEIIQEVLSNLLCGNKDECRRIVSERYPFFRPQDKQNTIKARTYTLAQMTKIFLRDGFIDRYTGDRLIFPGIFRILKTELPDDFPAHSAWKMTETHIVYWELFPTIDHIIPVAKGGTDGTENLVTTSMLKNMAKSNFTLDEIGWTIKEPGNINDWDGLTGMFIDLLNNNPELRKIQYIRTWENALIKAKIPGGESSSQSKSRKDKNEIITVPLNSLKPMQMFRYPSSKTQYKVLEIDSATGAVKVQNTNREGGIWWVRKGYELTRRVVCLK